MTVEKNEIEMIGKIKFKGDGVDGNFYKLHSNLEVKFWSPDMIYINDNICKLKKKKKWGAVRRRILKTEKTTYLGMYILRDGVIYFDSDTIFWYIHWNGLYDVTFATSRSFASRRKQAQTGAKFSKPNPNPQTQMLPFFFK